LVPIRALNDGDKGMTLHNLFKVKKFWLVMILMCCAGACEQSVSQWASAFAESELGISKSVGDLAGPCAFAVLMGISRVFYSKKSEKIKLETFMKISGLLCIAAYLLISLSPLPVFGLVGCGLCGLSVGIMWPGTFSIAAKEIKYGGTQMFAFLALSGDLGCSVGPTLVGVVSKAINNNLKIGILSAVVFPAVLIFALFLNKKNIKSVEIEKSEYNEKKR
ncbi:MAG: MFS transporter, partial [Clostridia bacterium]